METKFFKVRRSRRSITKLMKDARDLDKIKVNEGTHEWVYDHKMRSNRLVKKCTQKGK